MAPSLSAKPRRHGGEDIAELFTIVIRPSEHLFIGMVSVAYVNISVLTGAKAISAMQQEAKATKNTTDYV